jgi:hypothetical protein
MSKVKWDIVREALTLLQVLQRNPASRDDLIVVVQQIVPESFHQPKTKAQQRHFE